uniref:Uncharacterized protein n=1 Tax=Acrobeloides nanus TaxID=290746 RepID=A0A914DNI2_9BILA
MTSKTPQENVALLDRNHYEQTNVLNERIEQIRNEPETRFNEPPPAYEDVCPDKCIEKVEQEKPLNPYYVLVFQIQMLLLRQKKEDKNLIDELPQKLDAQDITPESVLVTEIANKKDSWS